jgi:hypothetical protein
MKKNIACKPDFIPRYRIGAICIRCFFLFILYCSPVSIHAQNPPTGWGDFKVGLVNNNTNLINVRTQEALTEGVKLDYRYVYIDNGVDTTTNAISWLFTPWSNYSKTSTNMGLKPAYVIYMLQEEGGATALKTNILDANFMRNYFSSIRIVAQNSKGMKPIFVIEPDTWGYFLQDALEHGTQSNPQLIPANINNLGAGYEYLNGLPNTLSGVAQAIIKTIKLYAPDAYCGLLMSLWGVDANGATGPPAADGAKGLVYWNLSDVNYSAQVTGNYVNQLLGTTGYRSDFIAVEKNGWSAGHWLAAANDSDFYWGDAQNSNWLSWSETLKQQTNLPLLGWQISIGHMGLPNTTNRYEDTFFPYFFTHSSQFINAGFIGLLVGKGTDDCTDYTNLHGNSLEADGTAGDNGWFLEQLKVFDKGRPYLNSSTSVCANSSSILIAAVSEIPGYSYQWQLSTNNGNSYNNISNGVLYSGVTTDTLSLNNTPSSMYGYLYRCSINGSTTGSQVATLKFADTWTGSINTSWETAGNWSCGTIPDANTDVIINTGSPVINSMVNIRSLELDPAATLTVSQGKQLNILH